MKNVIFVFLLSLISTGCMMSVTGSGVQGRRPSFSLGVGPASNVRLTVANNTNMELEYYDDTYPFRTRVDTGELVPKAVIKPHSHMIFGYHSFAYTTQVTATVKSVCPSSVSVVMRCSPGQSIAIGSRIFTVNPSFSTSEIWAVGGNGVW